MRKRYWLLCLLLLSASSLRAGISLATLRLQYIQALNDADLTDKLLAQLQAEGSSDPIIIGYVGGLQALVAKHSWNPYMKLEYLGYSQKTLAQAIAMSPDNVEIRFMRFSIQHYVPAFLGYSANLEEDKIAIIRNLPKAEPDIRQVVGKFLLDSKRCSDQECRLIKAMLT